MKDKALSSANRMMNLYRQAHAIDGGWAVVNEALLEDANPESIAELRQMPNGANLIQHIENLRSGATAMNSIDPNLAPYAGAFLKSGAVKEVEARAHELWNSANVLLTPPVSERAKAQAQADMPEFETYLPMFGDAGMELLERLRSFVKL